MSNIVFILGAGASKDAGAPLMADFLDVAESLMWTDEVQGVRPQFEMVFQVIGALQRVHSKSNLQLTNIEDVFAAFEMGAILKKLPGFKPEDTAQPVEALRTLMVKTLEKTLLFPMSGSTMMTPKPYDAFADLITHLHLQSQGTHNVSVLTFNYDIALDFAFHNSRVPFSYHLAGDRNGNEVPLLKLHGSLNWGICTQCQGATAALHLQDYFPQARLQVPQGSAPIEVPVGTNLYRHTHNAGHSFVGTPVLVPPTWNKYSGQASLRTVWAKAAEVLSQADDIYVCGYSYPNSDRFFHYLYALGSEGSRPLKRFQVHDPGIGYDDSGLKKRFEGLLGVGAIPRFQTFPDTFDQAIKRWIAIWS